MNQKIVDKNLKIINLLLILFGLLSIAFIVSMKKSQIPKSKIQSSLSTKSPYLESELDWGCHYNPTGHHNIADCTHHT